MKTKLSDVEWRTDDAPATLALVALRGPVALQATAQALHAGCLHRRHTGPRRSALRLMCSQSLI